MSAYFSFRRYFWGLVFIGLGVLLLLDNLHVIDFGDFVARFWPVIIIVVGLLIIFGKRPNRLMSTAISTRSKDRIKWKCHIPLAISG